jgi:hypothetical protein
MVEVDDKLWHDYNEQWFKVRQLNFEAAQFTEVKKLRVKVTAVRNTDEMKKLQEHWKKVTQFR